VGVHAGVATHHDSRVPIKPRGRTISISTINR